MIQARQRCVLSIDEGTTGVRAVAVDQAGVSVYAAYRRLSTCVPKPGHVLQDPTQIWLATADALREVIAWTRDNFMDPVAIAIANQRGTSHIWDHYTGQPTGPAVVWQDQCSAPQLKHLSERWGQSLLERIGHRFASMSPFYTHGQRLAEDSRLARRGEEGQVVLGTVDSWLIWKLTSGKTHAVSASNASSADMYDLPSNSLNDAWRTYCGIPGTMVPEIRDDDANFGETDPAVIGIRVPIYAVLGDQQAALLGAGCVTKGAGRCIHGTGTFVDVNAGVDIPSKTDDNAWLGTLVGWRMNSGTSYAIEGASPTTGSALSWICDSLRIFQDPQEISELADSVDDTSGVFFLPTLGGMWAPWYEPTVRGSLVGLTTSVDRAQIARAILEGIAHSVNDILEAVEIRMGHDGIDLSVGGGIAASDALMQLHADLLGRTVTRMPDASGTTALGAAYAAGCRAGLWPSLTEACCGQDNNYAVFEPSKSEKWRRNRRADWAAEIAQHAPPAQGIAG